MKELFETFKTKAVNGFEGPSTMSFRSVYQLKDFPNATFSSKRKFAFNKNPNEQKDSEENAKEKFVVLPFGVSIDPIKEIVLYCTWPEIVQAKYAAVVKSFADYDPMTAPQWSFRVLYEKIPLCFMSECLLEVIKISNSPRTLLELLGREYTYTGPADYTLQEEVNPLERLTESKIAKLTSSFLGISFPSSSSSVKKLEVKKPKAVKGPISEERLMSMLYYLFPDADDNSPYTYSIPDLNAVCILYS